MKIKVCYKCGAQQAENRFFCVDCNTKLGSPVSKEEAELHERKTKAMLDKLYNKSDPLYVSLLDKIFGFASLAGLITSVVFSIIYSDNLPISVGPLMLIIYMMFILCALNALLPNVAWSLEKLRLRNSYRNIDDAEPSGFYKIGRKISIYGCFIIAVGLLIYSLPILIDPSVMSANSGTFVDSYNFNGHEIEVYVDYN